MNNDIVTKARLNAAVGTEGDMGFEHNDIVTVDKMNEAIAGGGGGDFDVATITFNIDRGVGAFEYSALMDYPPYNPNASNQQQYAAADVIGNTKGPFPVTEIDSTQEGAAVMYQDTAYLETTFTLYSYETGDAITVSGYTLSGAAETVEDESSDFYGMIKVTGDCTITLTRE